jgi:hypothetical protein
LRLPLRHPELNPTELIWATVKNWVAEKNITFKLHDVIKLVDKNFAAITNKDWKERCAHVQNIENLYMSSDDASSENDKWFMRR